MPKFNNVELTQETILATRQHFADNSQACIDDVENNYTKVNDEQKYVDWMKQDIIEFLNGKHDHTFTFLQRAYWIQTGESIALLP